VRVTYLLAQPELNGGHKVIFQHVRLLQENGDDLTVLGEGPKPDWIEIRAPYIDYSGGPPKLREQDLVVATYWTTLPLARRFGLGPLAHFCQGYEGGLPHLRPRLAEIEAVYSWQLPTLTVAPHLGELLRQRFGRESRMAPPPLDPLFRPAWRLGPRRRPWIAIPGIFESEVKGIPTALAAVRRLREEGLPCRVLRFSTLALSEGERALLAPDRYLCGVPPGEIAAALRACDLLLFPSRPEEGFGLPLLEAMASKVPAVASRIPSAEHIADGAVPLVEAEGFAAAAWELLSSRSAWRRARERGFEASRRFRPEAVAPQLVESLRWARGRACS
jgi:glycosyltransferase involved in cell wall biosynthesis